MSILGNRVVRREDPKFLTTGGIYGDDLALDGALWATFVRSTVAHGRIAQIDVTEAKGLPGVVAIYTGDDTDLPPVPAGVPGFPEAMGRPVLAQGVVRFAGEPVAVILTEERGQGEDAAEEVFVDYEPLSPVVDAASGATGGTLLFPQHTWPSPSTSPSTSTSSMTVRSSSASGSSTSGLPPARSRCAPERRRGARTAG